MDRGGAGRRDIDDAGVRQRVLEPQARAPCCEAATSPRSPLPPPAFCIACASSKMRTPSKVGAQPFDDLPDARNLLAAVVGA